MSANNQTLVQEYKGKWYVFTNIMAESWYDPDGNQENQLSLQNAVAMCNTRDEAILKAFELDKNDDYGGTEYGVQVNELAKDGADVKIIE